MVIKYFATLRDITKKTDEQWNTPVDTLDELLGHLCRKYGKSFEKWVSSENGSYGSLSIFLVNGQDCRSINGLKTKVKDSDTISIFPPVAGG
jgi:MoaD family protein